MMNARSSELDRLADDLGDDHDLAVLLETLPRLPDDFEGREVKNAIEQGIVARREMLKTSARKRGQLLFAESPKRFVKRLKAYHAVSWKVS